MEGYFVEEDGAPHSVDYALEFDNVGFVYGGSEDVNVLKGFSLKVRCGECICITGPSGCGKTTVTRLVNGMIPSFYEGTVTGRIAIMGKDSDLWDTGELCQVVGSVFQNPRSQFFNLDTTSELSYGCENLGIPREEIVSRVAAAASVLGIEYLLERDMHDLSGGQRQLLSLGAACAMGADVLVLDEPTANLDATATRAVARALARLKGQGKTIVIVEHRLHWLGGLVDRVVLMRDGAVAGSWRAEEFARIPAKQREEMGLRAWSLEELRPCACVRGASDGGEPEFDVQADGLRAGYGSSRDVLKGASFSLESGHVVAVIGCNGAGKTTLARVICGLTQETYGGVSIDARAVPVRERPGRAFLVLQEPGYQLFGASVRAEFNVGARIRSSQVGDAADELIARFGLAGKEERHPASLSGGEQQRLALAVGVHTKARLLVLDEPTSGLDLLNMHRVAAEIRRLADEGCCVLVVTHDAEFVAAACDQVLEIDDGCVRECYRLDGETWGKATKVLSAGMGP